jgi:hypothetical protein
LFKKYTEKGAFWDGERPNERDSSDSQHDVQLCNGNHAHGEEYAQTHTHPHIRTHTHALAHKQKRTMRIAKSSANCGDEWRSAR